MDRHIYNLNITRDREPARLGKHMDETSLFIGEFIVHNSGRLVHGRDPNLHIDSANLEYNSDHIHFNGSMPASLGIIKGEPHLVDHFHSEPHFTLQGLYNTAGVQDSKKASLLIKEIKRFKPGFEFESIAVNENTRLKLLENAYRRNVSDQ